MRPLRTGSWTAWLFGAAGCALLATLSLHVSWREVAGALKGAALSWLIAMSVASVASVSLRAWRFSLILGDRLQYRQVWRAVALGYFGSLFLPLGGGELVKVAVIQREGSLTFARASTALAMDRLFDVIALLVLVAALIGQRTLPDMRTGPLALLAAAAMGLGTLFMLLMVSGNAIKARLAAWAARHPGRHPWIARFDEIHDQAAWPLRHRLRMPGLCALQALIFITDIAGAGFGLFAFPFGHGLPAAAPVRLALFVMLGFGLPLLPGGLGSHQAATILALHPYGIGASQSLALSLAAEALHFAVLATLGLVAAFWGGYGALALFRQRRMLDSPHPPEAP